MVESLIWVTVASLVLGLVSGRILLPENKELGAQQNDSQDLPEDSTLNELFLQADPSENEIFFELRPVVETDKQFTRPSPTDQLRDNISKPRYTDASEFRQFKVLPPALDINRQLTLLSASKRVVPPTFVVLELDSANENNTDSNGYLSNPLPLFREDFPVDVNYDQDYLLEDPNETTEGVQTSDILLEPIISTSVSVSVSYSNESSVLRDNSTVKLSSSQTTAPTALLYTTTTNAPSPSVIEEVQSPVSKEVITEATAVEPLSAGQNEQIWYEILAENPVRSVLSPLSHILGGFHAEDGPLFTGDVANERSFISAFRPDDF